LIPFCVGAWLTLCAVFGADTLPTPGPTSESAASVLPRSGIEKASAGQVARGIDISRWAGEPTVEDFQKIRQQGHRFVIVGGWGGVKPNPHAQVQLSRARSAGLLTAGYCYLNFAAALDGRRQVREALAAFGTEADSLGFLAIDVETSAANQLSPGLRRATPEASAQQGAAVRIAEAVQQVEQSGLRPVIYTKKDDWQRVTGDTQQFKNLPLWHPKTIAGDDLNQPPLASPDNTFGGWTRRLGKQYDLDTMLQHPPIRVDLDVFDLSAFSASGPKDRQLSSIQIAVTER